MAKQKDSSKAVVLSTYDLMRKYPTEESAVEYLMPILWPEGPFCPYCGSKNHRSRRKLATFFCSDCRQDFTIRTNTIFHRSHIPLNKWLFAMYIIVTARKGISSLQLSKEIGVRQSTAWFMSHRIRAACGNQIRSLLSGIVEADETYLGGKEKNKHSDKKLNAGRGAVGKTPVFGMRDRDGNVVMQRVLKTDSETLKKAILDNVRKDSTLCTDESKSYNGMEEHFDHRKVNHSAKQYVDGMAHTNSIESVWALLKRGFYGTFHSFSRKHTGSYIKEFAFRLNQGNVNIDTADRIRSLVQGCMKKRLTYKLLTQGGWAWA